MPNNKKIIQERIQRRLALSKPKTSKFYNRDEDIKRKKRQKENYAKKQAEKGLIVKNYEDHDTQKIFTDDNSFPIFRLKFNK